MEGCRLLGLSEVVRRISCLRENQKYEGALLVMDMLCRIAIASLFPCTNGKEALDIEH